MAASGGQLGGFFEHHVPKAVCDTRAKYREGRRPRAVRVYTINLESQYLLIQGVPAVGAMKELVERFALYGAIEQYNALDEYPAEEFTEVFLIKFTHLQSARTAKRKMDEQSFFGGLLHVCYAPEFETVEETRRKLESRRAYIARCTRSKDRFPTKRKPLPAQDPGAVGPDFPAGACWEAARSTPAGHMYPPLPYSYELPLGCFTGSPGECVGGPPDPFALGASHFDAAGPRPRDPPQKPSAASTDGAACAGTVGVITASAAVSRFMPRTTQLQERKRRREDDRKLEALLARNPSSTEVVIGPLLPREPQVDMQDPSLNATATLIRNKLREVSSSAPKPAEGQPEAAPASRPLKQRRRI